jgi:hypothetical protein
MKKRLYGLVWFCRDLLACVGLAVAVGYVGHPGIGGGLAFLGACVAVGARLPGVYAPGDAGALGPHD